MVDHLDIVFFHHHLDFRSVTTDFSFHPLVCSFWDISLTLKTLNSDTTLEIIDSCLKKKSNLNKDMEEFTLKITRNDDVRY